VGKLTDVRAKAKEMSDAHVRLNAFYSVISLLEGGTLPGGSRSANATAEKIIRLCESEAQVQLRIHDRALDQIVAINSGAPK
jgi:hypothetical protein